MNNAFRLKKFICTLFISLLKCVQLKFRQSINLVIVWSFIKGINPISFDVSFKYKVCSCKMPYAHFCCHSISAWAYIVPDRSTGSNSRKAGDCEIMASAVFACVLLRPARGVRRKDTGRSRWGKRSWLTGRVQYEFDLQGIPPSSLPLY